MNPDLVQKALEKVPNRHVLINLISSRVRQLNSGIGTQRQPLIIGSGNLSSVDTALRELIEGRMTFQMPEFIPLKRPTQQGSRPKGWTRIGKATEAINAANGFAGPSARAEGRDSFPRDRWQARSGAAGTG